MAALYLVAIFAEIFPVSRRAQGVERGVAAPDLSRSLVMVRRSAAAGPWPHDTTFIDPVVGSASVRLSRRRNLRVAESDPVIANARTVSPAPFAGISADDSSCRVPARRARFGLHRSPTQPM